MPPGLSIVIVCWNAAPVIPGCLDSLLDNPPERPFEILVLDNRSSDGTREIVRSFGSRVELVELPENRGFAGACNEGSRRAHHDYLLFLNSDIRAHPGALECLSRLLDDRPEAAAAGGKLVDAGGAPQRGFNVRAFPTLLSSAFEILMIEKLFPGNPVSRAQRMLDFDFSETSEVDQPAGACLLVRKSVFESVGRFDEIFHPAWFEDVDLCLRLKKQGHRIFFVPGASFLHYGGASLETLGYAEFLSIWYRNLRRFFAKHRGKGADALLRALIAAGMVKRMAASLLLSPKPGISRGEARAAYRRVLRETL